MISIFNKAHIETSLHKFQIKASFGLWHFDSKEQVNSTVTLSLKEKKEKERKGGKKTLHLIC